MSADQTSNKINVDDYPPGTFPPGWKVVTPKEVVWLNTIYVTIPTDNILSLVPGEVISSDVIAFRGVPELFVFQVVICYDYHLATSLCRYRLAGLPVPPDEGSFLICDFSVVGFSDQPPISVALLPGCDSACALFSLSSALRKFRELNTTRYVFDVKAVVKMVEHENMPGEARDSQEAALGELRETLSEEQVQDLGVLLERPGLVDVFTGRANSVCAETKLTVIKRTAPYARRILQYLEAKKRKDAVYREDFSSIINCLINGEEGPLNVVDTMLAYLLGHTTWIPYLTIIMKDHIISQLEGDVNLVVEVLQLSNHVEDKDLFEKTAVKYLERMEEVENSETYRGILEQTPHMIKAIVHAVTVFMNTTDVWIPGWKAREKRNKQAEEKSKEPQTEKEQSDQDPSKEEIGPQTEKEQSDKDQSKQEKKPRKQTPKRRTTSDL